MLYSLSHLEGKQVEELKRIEKKLGRTVLAYSGYSSQPAPLSEEQIHELQAAEKKLGLCLIAVEG